MSYSPPIGQDKIISFLISAKKDGRLSHTYILEGGKGSGKRTIAKYLSLILMCKESVPCLKCKMCTYTISGTNPDIYTVSNEDKASIGIGKIRELIKEAYIMPSVSKKKIFIIENAHLLTKESQNALLKIIEEPPSYAVFLLLCENTSMLLPTVLSRAVVIKIPPLREEDLIKITGCSDKLLAGYAFGNPGRLTELLNDKSFSALRDGFFEKILSVLNSDGYALYETYNFFEENKESKNELMEMTLTFFRDVLFFKNQCENHIINKDKLKIIKAFSDRISKNQCEKICEISAKAKNELGKYGAYAVSIHAMLIRIWEEIYG